MEENVKTAELGILKKKDYILILLALFASFAVVINYMKSDGNTEEKPIYFSFWQNEKEPSADCVCTLKFVKAHYHIETLPTETIVKISSKAQLNEMQKRQIETFVYAVYKYQMESQKKRTGNSSFVWETEGL